MARKKLAFLCCMCNTDPMNALSPIDEIARDCLAVRVRLLARTISNLYDQRLAVHGLTIAQANLMVAVGKVGVATPGQLGEILRLERSTVSRNLNLLIRDGLVRVVSEDAKGLREVELTTEGRARIEALLPDWREAQAEARKILGGEGEVAVRGMSEMVRAIA